MRETFLNFKAAAALFAVSAFTAHAQNIPGAGATFPNPIYQRWFVGYSRLHPDVKINYQSVGSGAGIKQVSEGTVDFGASDAIMTQQQISDSKVKVIAIPTVLRAVVPVYNPPGVQAEINFSQDAIAGISLGKITKWNDPYLTRENPGVNLPYQTILPIYRSEGRGTTFIFTDCVQQNLLPNFELYLVAGPHAKQRSSEGAGAARIFAMDARTG